eukprot:Amastigsp_a343124_17.p2 type:complete len:322 gc:universal Amastigsp_a343124_17:754-1719(+)
MRRGHSDRKPHVVVCARREVGKDRSPRGGVGGKSVGDHGADPCDDGSCRLELVVERSVKDIVGGLDDDKVTGDVKVIAGPDRERVAREAHRRRAASVERKVVALPDAEHSHVNVPRGVAYKNIRAGAPNKRRAVRRQGSEPLRLRGRERRPVRRLRKKHADHVHDVGRESEQLPAGERLAVRHRRARVVEAVQVALQLGEHETDMRPVARALGRRSGLHPLPPNAEPLVELRRKRRVRRIRLFKVAGGCHGQRTREHGLEVARAVHDHRVVERRRALDLDREDKPAACRLVAHRSRGAHQPRRRHRLGARGHFDRERSRRQ